METDAPSRSRLTYHRIYPDARAKWGWYGESHFEMVQVCQGPGDSPAPAHALSGPAFRYRLCSAEPGWTADWHPVAARQFIIVLAGTIEVETSDGSRKEFRPGDIILLEDTWGKGHRSKNTGGDHLHVFVVEIPVT